MIKATAHPYGHISSLLDFCRALLTHFDLASLFGAVAPAWVHDFIVNRELAASADIYHLE